MNLPFLTDEACLALWDRGAARHAIDRALLLAAAGGDAPVAAQAWADIPLGTRDKRLLALRCAWFGPGFDARLDCPACREALSLKLDLSLIVDAAPDTAEAFVEAAGLRFRRPTTRDLAALATTGARDVEEAALRLLSSLALDAAPTGGWLPHHLDTLDAALDSADPLAHVEVAVTCEHCGHAFTAPLDIGVNLWDDLNWHCDELATQVHVLAGAYGWSEQQILALTPNRRRLYLRQVQS